MYWNNYKKIVKVLAYFKYKIILLLFLSIVALLCSLIPPLSLKIIFDDIIPNKNLSLLLLLLILIVGIYFVSSILSQTIAVYSTKINNSLDNKFKHDFISSIFKLDYLTFSRINIGDMASRVNEVSTITKSSVSLITDTILDSVSLLIFVALLFTLSTELALYSLAIFPVVGFLIVYFNRILCRVNKKVYQKKAKFADSLYEYLKGFVDIKINLLEKVFLGKLHNKLREANEEELNKSKIGSMYNNINGLIIGIGSFLIIYKGVYLIIGGALTIGELVAFNAFMIRIFGPLSSLLSSLRLWSDISSVIERIEELFKIRKGRIAFSDSDNTKAEIISEDRLQKMGSEKFTLEFIDVKFQYNSENTVFENASLKAREGDKILLLGPSGSGKTTLLNLIQKLYIPKQGKILINQVELEKFPNEYIFKNISCLNQESFLFQGTFLENISFWGRTNNEIISKVDDITQKTDIQGYINSLKEGYESEVEQFGRNLSIGQKQRICLARTLFKNSKIILLDEPTSNLDYETEKNIFNKIGKLFDDKIVIVASHRRNLSLYFNRVFIVGNNKLQELDKEDHKKVVFLETDLPKELATI